MEEANQNHFLTDREAGDYLLLKNRTLHNMRWMGRGPSFRKLADAFSITSMN